MKIIDCKQGTPEWLAARAGIPTASCFDKIVTPKELKPSASARGYAMHLLAEYYTGSPIETEGSGFMERGTDMEAEAVGWYAMQTGADVKPAGFCLHDEGIAGCSPDRLVGEDGLLEVKCPGMVKHLTYLMFGFDDYRLQVQGQLWITGRAWCDKLSYHPTLDKVVKRIERDDEVIKALDEGVRSFVGMLEHFKQRVDAMRTATLQAAAVGDDIPF